MTKVEKDAMHGHKETPAAAKWRARMGNGVGGRENKINQKGTMVK